MREEWDAALPAVREAGASWAPFLKLRDATAADFDEIDQNHGNYIDFREVRPSQPQSATEPADSAPDDLPSTPGRLGGCSPRAPSPLASTSPRAPHHEGLREQLPLSL